MSTEIRAQNSLALTSVKAIKDATDQSTELLSQMQQAAEDAGTTLNGIYQDAEQAKTGAESATNSANIALAQLGFVEDIVGVLDLVAKNGVYELTEDTEVVPDKWYFTRSGTDPDYVYAVVNNPTGDPSTQGWYELTGISDSIQNYVSSHLALVGDTLALKTEGSPYRLELTTNGMRIVGLDGKALAEYGTSTIIGDRSNFHVRIDGNEIGFYNNDTRLAYVNGSELYVTNSLAFGHFTFIERDNGHFTLKLIRSS